MPRLKICPEFRLTEEQWAEITGAGRIQHTPDPNLRRGLEWDIWHYRKTRDEFEKGATRKELREALKAAGAHLVKLVRTIERQPEILAPMAGFAARDRRLPRMLADFSPRERVDFYVEGLLFLCDWVHAVRAMDPSGREHRFPGGPNADPPTQQFMSVLVHKWRDTLRRTPSNWVGTKAHEEPAADLTRFVHCCLRIAGRRLTLEAVRGRLRTVLKGMRETEADSRR
jgi:hypothetical protein